MKVSLTFVASCVIMTYDEKFVRKEVRKLEANSY